MTITDAGISSSHPHAALDHGAFDPEGFDLNEISRTLHIGPRPYEASDPQAYLSSKA
jgi:hypothetical protein